jgi:hypothetical protein
MLVPGLAPILSQVVSPCSTGSEQASFHLVARDRLNDHARSLKKMA